MTVALLWTVCARGATIEVLETNEAATRFVTVAGEMVLDDVDAFRTKTAAVQSAVVLLQSDGGSLVAGIEIGKIIRFRNFETLVANGARCASACAIAWL